VSEKKHPRLRARLGDLKFVIEQIESPASCLLHVYNNGDCIGDHRLRSLEAAKRMARETYRVSVGEWEEDR
jgi:hypothetical protein